MGVKMKVKKIVRQKNGKYKIIFDNNESLLTYDEVILKNKLITDKQISNQLLEQLKAQNCYYDIYNKCLKYISVKMRSEKEIDKYLDKFDISKNNKIAIIKKLKNIGLIDDLTFTKAYINDRLNLSNDGPNKIKKALLKNNISEEDIDRYLEKIDYNQIIMKIDKLILKKVKLNKGSNKILRQKIIKNLLDLGFDYNLIIERINLNLKSDLNNLQKEYKKCYLKYQDKYQGKELYYKIKQHLYQKGYGIEEINKVMTNNC